MSEGDSLLYLDAGCHLNIEGKKRLIEYFELLKESKTGILAFQENSPNTKLKHDGRQLHDRPNYHWIKGDVFDYFGVREDPDFTHAQSFTAGIILVRKCKAAVEIIDEWQSITTSNFSLLDDTPSRSRNLEGFIEHRHDQAIFSLLCIQHKVMSLSSQETWYPKRFSAGQLTPSISLKPDWDALKYFPIHAKRDKDLGPPNNTKNQVKIRHTKDLQINKKDE